MNRWAHGIGRGLASVGLGFTGAYLAWRFTTLPTHAPLWLIVLALAVEIVGFAGSLLLCWALWPLPPLPPEHAADATHHVDVVVRVIDQPVHAVRATLMAAQSMRSGRTVIVDLGARVEVVALATEFDTLYAAPDVEDHNGLKTAAAASAAPLFLLLDAGDIPHPDAIAQLLPRMDDDRVAVVIGQSMMADDDSAGHGPNGIHELTFDRAALNPALSRRGAAILTESGALLRRAAVESVQVGDEEPIEAQSCWSLDLMAQGWRLIADAGEPVIVRAVINSQEAVYEQRVAQARASRMMLFGPGGILRWNRLPVRQRLAVAAAAVRPLSGLRRVGLLAVLVGSLLTGALPLRPDATVLGAVWAPGWVLTSLGLFALSRGTLRPGDRARWSLRNLGASWQGLRHPMAFDQRRAPVLTPHALQHGGALVGSVVVLSAVLMVRGLSEQWSHALAAMPYRWLAGLIAVSLWSLAMALDVLRMMGRRNQLRRATRIVASIPAEVGDHPVAMLDLTPLGVGFETSVEMAVKEQFGFQATITTATGCDDVSLPLTVRHVHQVGEERWRVGAEFGDATPAAVNALIEFCTVEPARRRLGIDTGQPVDEPWLQPVTTADPVADGRRMTLRLVALLAVLGAIASAQPGDGTPVAWLVSALSILVAAGVLAGSARPRRPRLAQDQSTSSASPDLAMR
jgi:hypothetical protein